MTNPEARPISASRSIMTEMILPADMNHYGTMFGGQVMRYIDKIAAIASMRHARKKVVTASSDSLDFLAPVKLGEAIELEAYVTWTSRSSMEVYVRVESEDLLTGHRTLTATSYLTFVALGEDGRPCKVPPVIPETDEERYQHEAAPARYAARKQRKRDLLEQLKLEREERQGS